MDKMSMKCSRRVFGMTTALTAAGSVFTIPTFIPRTVMAQGKKPGVNDRIRIGCVSAGGRARLLMEQLPEDGELVALADCNMPQALGFRKEKNANWDIYGTHYPLLDRKDIDAMIIAGQEFQRVFTAIHACQAGKDVYAEKTLMLYIAEGRALVNIARKYNTIFQVGTQQRSMEMNRVACEFVRNGGLGKNLYARGIAYPGIGPTNILPNDAEEPMPSGFNWDLHLNQGVWHLYHSGVLNGRNFFNGEMTNWGCHGVDQIQWALGKDDTFPVEFEPTTEGDNGCVTARYADGMEVRFDITEGGPWGGGIFQGDNGKLEINRNKFMSNPIEIRDELLKQVDEAEEEVKWSDQTALWQARWHLQNWLDCIRTRERPHSDVETGFRSCGFCELVNITRWMGRRLKFDPVAERFVGDDEANYWCDRPRRRGYELPEN